jgi:outer membrane protein assembly factor BamE (lipoprotein component of BamABCDE complex)
MSRRLSLLLLAVFLAGCASDGRHLRPGVSDRAAVRADMGTPAEVHALPQGGEVWFYPKGFGRATFRVELAGDGKVKSVEQVLDERTFDRIAAGKTTREELRLMLGPPFRTWRTRSEEVWEYHYLWGGEAPWTLEVGIGPNDVVTGQARIEERNGGSGADGRS